MPQKLPIRLPQIKAGNKPENLLNEIRKIMYSLYRPKEIAKKVYNSMMNSVKLWNRIDAIFMNYENSETSDPHRLLLNLSDEINLKRNGKYFALSKFSNYYTCKNIKISYKNNKFKISTSAWNEEFELPDRSYSVSDIQDYSKEVTMKMVKMCLI